MIQILALSIKTIVNLSRDDLGRYFEVVPAGSTLTQVGVEMEFFDRGGKTVKGYVVDKQNDIRAGKFPTVKGFIVDTKFNMVADVVERKRMQRIQQRLPSTPKPNKRATP